jgi:signal transduction histidine kinase
LREINKDLSETDQLPELLDAIHSSERYHSELLASLSHELRIPLTTIKGYATALQLEEVEWSPEKRREFLKMIEIECDHMEVMLTELLASSLIEVNQLTLELQPLRLPRVAEQIVEEMQRRTEIHDLIVDFPAGFPPVEADPQWIRHVLCNILDNSIKYSPEGGLIVIRGESRRMDVVISVSDQGIGVSPEDLVLIFERYFRAKSSVVSNIPGTGLGLPIARAIVEAHGGRVWAESRLGQGTTLSFSLPISNRGKSESRP